MVKRTGPTNPYLRGLAENLKKKAFELDAPIWNDISKKLTTSSRKRVEVNLSNISRESKDNDTVIIPGVVLGSGNLTKKVTIAGWRFSSAAKEKIKAAGGNIVSIEQLLEKNPKGSHVRIMV